MLLAYIEEAASSNIAHGDVIRIERVWLLVEKDGWTVVTGGNELVLLGIEGLVYYCQVLLTTAKGKIVGNSRFDDTKETSNETKGLKRKAGILQKMEDFEDSRRSP
ncbi:hypothetical protein Tco_1209067 [Tanacetum coccineum]